MYARHFHLDELPFSISPDPRFLYLSPRHQEALAHLLYGVGEGGGFVALTGEVGTGKTTLCNTLLEQLPDNVDLALILNPRLDPIELMQSVCDELKVAYPPWSRSLKVLGDALNRYLLEAHGRGRRTILLIDEAQNLSFEVLEQVRLLTNLETHTTKLLQILLVGQPELAGLLGRPELRQLNQRVTARYHLGPLTRDECRAYVEHRLRVCGGAPGLFTQGALRRVWRYARGVPRLINVICDRALLGAFVEGRHRVTASVVEKAERELSNRLSRRHRGWAGAVAAAAAVLLGLAAWAYLRSAGEPFDGLAGRTGTPTLEGPPVESPSPAGVAAIARDAAPDTRRPRGAVGATTEVAPETPASVGGAAGLASLLEGAATGLDAAFEALFRRWGLPTRGRGLLNCEGARTLGVECLAQQGDWGQLVRFNHPAILEFPRPDGRKRYALLTALEGDDPVLRLAGENLRVPLKDLLARWDGHFVLLWRPPAPSVTLLARGAASPEVAWVEERIAADPAADEVVTVTGVYDEALEAVVRRFQRRNGLAEDGIAGPRTLVMLAATEGEQPGGPRLRR